MHPPFYSVDHKIGPDIHIGHEKPRVKRGAPARLDMVAVSTGWPPIPLVAPAAPLKMGPQLFIVPPPKHVVREWFGRMLIRTGQRMIAKGLVG